MNPRASGHLVEEKANGAAVMSMLHRSIPGIVPILPHGSKTARAVAITPILSAGNIWIPDPSIAPWSPEFVEECARFRGSDSEINDQVDTATQAVNYLNQTRYPDPGEDETGVFIEDAEAAGVFSE
jgi:predicted phage terminase large subunit-like protein